MNRLSLYCFFFISLFSFKTAWAFDHPCILHTQSDFEYVKNHIDEEPYASALVKLKKSQYCKTSYKASPVEYLARLDATNWSSLNSRWENAGIADLWYEGIHNNYTNFMRDAAAAYQLALLYSLENDTKAADAAKNIILAWSTTNKGILRNKQGEIIDPNEKLIMFQPYQMAAAIEMLRDYNGWGTTSEFNNVLSWIDTSFYPLCHEHLELQNSTGGGHYWMNWDLASMTTVLALGILTDNQNYVDEAINFYKGMGGGPGNIKKGVPYLHNDPDSNEILGQGNELGRDQGHNTLCAAVLGTFCKMALEIGEDLFAYDNYRAIAFAEYVAKYNLANQQLYPNPMDNFSAMKVGESDSDFEYAHSSFPFTTYTYGDQGTHRAPSQDGRGTVRPGWDYWTGYCNTHGISSIYSTKLAERIRPDGGGGQYSSNSGGFDQIGFSTLMGFRPLDNSANDNEIDGNDRLDDQGGTLVLLPVADTQVRKENTTDYGGNTNMEIYYTENKDGSRNKEFYGLMRYELPSDFTNTADFKVAQVILRLVCTQNKQNRDMGLFPYRKSFSEHTTFEIEETYVREALAQSPFATFTANGQSPRAMHDAGLTADYQTPEGWTSYINITDYVKNELSRGETTLSFLVSKINPTEEAMRFATKEAETIQNDAGFSFEAALLVPELTILYAGKLGGGIIEEPKEEPKDDPEEPSDEENKDNDEVDSPETPETPDTPQTPDNPEEDNQQPTTPEPTPDEPEQPSQTPEGPEQPNEPTTPDVTPNEPTTPELPSEPEPDPTEPNEPQIEPDDSLDNGETEIPDNDENNSEENESENDGVNSILEDQPTPVYFDLTGRRIMHPQPGQLYIEKKGKETKKIIFQN